jgi:hypothetical protein
MLDFVCSYAYNALMSSQYLEAKCEGMAKLRNVFEYVKYNTRLKKRICIFVT